MKYENKLGRAKEKIQFAMQKPIFRCILSSTIEPEYNQNGIMIYLNSFFIR